MPDDITPIAGGYGPGNRNPCAVVTHSAAQAINNATVTTLAWDTLRSDNNSIWSSGANTRLTCKTAGVYWIWALIGFAANATGERQARLVHHTSGGVATNIAIVSQQAVTVGNATRLFVGRAYTLAVDEYIEFRAYQDSGGALNVDKSSAFAPEAGMSLVSV